MAALDALYVSANALLSLAYYALSLQDGGDLRLMEVIRAFPNFWTFDYTRYK
jgi:hypothetical protein